MENQNSKEMLAVVGMPGSLNPGRTEEAEYQRTVEIVYERIRDAKKSFVVIGWCLCRIKERQWYLKENCRDIYQFAQQKFQFSQSNTSRCMGLWRKFSRGDDSPELDVKFEGYSISQLTEMLPLEMADLEYFHPGMTVQEIRDRKREILKERRKLNGKGDADEGDKDDGFAASHMEADGESAVQDTYTQPDLPIFHNDMERKEWIGDFDAWGGLWYEDEKIGIRYYKFKFFDGSELIAAQYRYTCPPYMKLHPSQYREQVEADGTYYGEISYHMVFSDWYWERHEDEYMTNCQRYFTHSTVTVAALVDFLNELQEWEDNGSPDMDDIFISNEFIMKELDFDHLDKAESYIGRKYAGFYRKNGYIPRCFNANNGTEVTGYANTLTTSCGQASGYGGIVFFDAEKEAEMILEDGSVDKATAHRQIQKIRRIAEPSERQKVECLLEEYKIMASA